MSDPARRVRRRLLLSTVPAAAVVPLIFLFPWFGWHGLPGRTLFEEVTVPVVLLLITAAGSIGFGLASLSQSAMNEAKAVVDGCTVWAVAGLGIMLYLAYEHSRFPYYQTPITTYYVALLSQLLVLALCLFARRALTRPPAAAGPAVGRLPGPASLVAWAGRAAADYGLGELRAWNKERTTGLSLVLFVISLAFIPLGLWVGRFGWNAMWNLAIPIGDYVVLPRIVGAILLLPAMVCLAIPVFALVNLLHGPEAVYAFARGVVRAQVTRADVILWSDVANLTVWAKPNVPSTYAVVARDGRRIAFSSNPRAGADSFDQKMVAVAQALGVPIQPAGPDDPKPS